MRTSRSHLLVRRDMAVFALLAVAVASPWPGTARAALVALGFDELALRSELILCGEVVDAVSYEAPFLASGFCVFTDVTLRVTRRIKGDLREERVTVQVLGGATEERRQHCPESARFRLGEHVLVFLARYNGALWTTGWLQGKYTLGDGGATVNGRRGLPIAREIPLSRIARQVERLAKESARRERTAGAPGDRTASGESAPDGEK